MLLERGLYFGLPGHDVGFDVRIGILIIGLLFVGLLASCDKALQAESQQQSQPQSTDQLQGQSRDKPRDEAQLSTPAQSAVITPGQTAAVSDQGKGAKRPVSIQRPPLETPPALPLLPPYAQPYDKLYQEGLALAQRGHHQLAIDKLEKAVEMSPGRIEFLYNLGVAYTFIDPLDARAEAVYLQAIKLAPRASARKRGLYLPGIYYNLASLYSLKKEPDTAFDWLDKAFKAGFDDYHLIIGDEDFAAYRQDQRYKKLIKGKWPD